MISKNNGKHLKTSLLDPSRELLVEPISKKETCMNDQRYINMMGQLRKAKSKDSQKYRTIRQYRNQDKTDKTSIF